MSVQAQILNLLEDMKARYGLTLVFIAHDLAVVKNVSDRVAVMYLGRMCEVGPPDMLYAQPGPPVHRSRCSTPIPVPDPEVRPQGARRRSRASCPRRSTPPSGCRFRTRCPRADERCAPRSCPRCAHRRPDQFVACHHPLVETAVDVGTATSRG